MSATTASVQRLREHARAKITEVATADHNPDCLCGNRIGALTGWSVLAEITAEIDPEGTFQALAGVAETFSDPVFGGEAGLALAEVIDEGRVVAGQVLLADGTIAPPLSATGWDAFLGLRDLAGVLCPRCGRVCSTGATWPDCARHGDHETWCTLPASVAECDPCIEDMAAEDAEEATT